MQKRIFLYLIGLLLFSCEKERNIEFQAINDTELEYEILEEYQIDSSKILYPTGIFSFQDYLILMEPKNNPVLSFYTLDSLKYLFSSGYKGGGPNELIRPRNNYFASSDSTFFLLDSNIEREIKIRDNSFSIRSNTPILVPDAINQMIHIDSCHYIMCGFTTGEGKEHIKYENGAYSDFGDYPLNDLKEEKKVILNMKFTAGREDKNVILDFYRYQNLVRMYSTTGVLEKEICFSDLPDWKNRFENITSKNAHLFWSSNAVSDADYIYVLYYGGITNGHLSAEKGSIIPEFQVWSWEGKLIRRIKFDKSFNQFTVGENKKIYALNISDENKSYVVYVYDLTE